MKKTRLIAALALSALAWSATIPAQVQAQRGGGGGFGGGMGGGMRNNPKTRLTGLVRGAGELEKGGKAALSKVQAKQFVGLIFPWQKKPHMSEDEAKGLYMKLNAVLTIKQKNELDRTSAMHRRFGGNGGGGQGGGWRGGNGAGGPPSDAERQQMRQRMQAMKGFFQTYNPFYPPTKYPELAKMPDRMKQGMTRRFQRQQATLSLFWRKATT